MLKFKIVIIKSLLFLLILNTSQALAISGKEIKELIKEHLLIHGITSNPLIRESRKFKDCDHKLNIENPYDSFRTVIVSCKTPLKWQVSIRTNAESKLQTKSKSKNSDNLKNTCRLRLLDLIRFLFYMLMFVFLQCQVNVDP